MQRLKRMRLQGWKSIRDQTIELTPLTVLIGANGAGKSSLLSVFKLINAMFANTPGLRTFVGLNGFADSMLHFGSKTTPVAEMELVFDTDTGETTYYARWAATSGGSLLFTEERVSFHRTGAHYPLVVDLGSGHTETHLIAEADSGNRTAEVVLRLLRGCRMFHFHDTSNTSSVRKTCSIETNRYLFPDAGNLPAMLYLFREKHPAAFRRITATVQQMVPDFDSFVLEPRELNASQILLNWKHKDRDYEFGPHQLSDGTIRFISLATLMLQPTEKLPLLLTLDEPELGLHPAALEILAEMVMAASQHTQIVLATQSSVFLDHIDPGDVIAVDCKAGVSEFRRLNPDKLTHWLELYTLGEVWEKNVVGAGPYG